MRRRDDLWLRDLYDSQWSSMVQLATLLLGSSSLAEEVVQDALVATHQRRQQFITDRHARAYLRTAVVNRTRAAHRERIVDPAADRADEHAPVLAAIDTLPQRQREVLVLRYWGEASESEVAETLGISRNAVRTQTQRGVQAVRIALAGARWTHA